MRQITIAGTVFSVPEPYAEGQVLQANEAQVLNQTYAENIRNNFAGKVKKAKESENFDLNALQEELDQYISTYVFGVRRTGTAVHLDPVEKEARKIAGDAVTKMLREKGFSRKDVGSEKFASLVDQALERYGEQITEKARTIVAARSELGDGTLDIEI